MTSENTSDNTQEQALNKTDVSGCTAEFPFFGAKYPDARCIDGYLHDMDKCDENGNLYLMDESYPCPFCNREEFIQQQKDNEEDLEKVSEWINYINSKYNLQKVYQRLVDAGNGDCMKCAIATLLNLKYEEVPHFLEFENPNSGMINFMLDKGFDFECCLYNYPNSEYSTIEKLKDFKGINGLFYASVFSPKYYKEENGIEGHQVTHAVVINKNFEIVFDPNREYKNIKEYPASDKLGYKGIKNIYLFTPKVV